VDVWSNPYLGGHQLVGFTVATFGQQGWWEFIKETWRFGNWEQQMRIFWPPKPTFIQQTDGSFMHGKNIL